MIKRILAGICDAQHTLSVSDYARELAQRFDAQVTAIAVTDMQRLRNIGPVAIGAGSLASELLQERIDNNEAAIRRSLNLFVRRLDEAQVACQVIHASGDPIEALAKASRYHDLMIFGLRGLLEHGVTDEPPDEMIQLIESGVRPVLAIGPTYRETQRVLIAYSGSAQSAETMRSFAESKLWPTAQIKVVHFARQKKDGVVLLTEARSYLQDHGYDVEIELIAAAPRTQLLKYAADWQADLIVVGNSGKSLLRRRVFGETALHTMRESELPLFLSQ